MIATMDSRLKGNMYELKVAAMLSSVGLYPYVPLVDIGADLVVTNRENKKFVPVQVKGRRKESSIVLTNKDDAFFAGKRFVIAYFIDEGPNRGVWFIPHKDWTKLAKSPNRRDDKKYVTIRDNRRKLERFKGRIGLFRAFDYLRIGERNVG